MGYEGGMLVIRDKDARDSGQLLFFREKCYIFALSFRDRLNLPLKKLIVEPLKKERKKKMKKEVWKTILQVIIAVLTAVGTTLGVTSCM